MFPAPLLDEARRLLDAFRACGAKLATAESCTGGLLCGVFTEIAGSSDVVDCGFVTYSNAAKQRQLGVPGEMLLLNGAISDVVARAMAAGALAQSGADVAVSVTGLTGPGGGSAAKPVGLVYLGLARIGRPTVHWERRFGDVGRTAVRLQAIEAALALLWQAFEA